MLSKQLQAQIEQEAKDYAQKREEVFRGQKHLHRKTLLMYAHQDGAKGYADQLSAATARADRYEKALGAILNTNHDNYEKVIMKVKAIATEALTPKTSSDERRL